MVKKPNSLKEQIFAGLIGGVVSIMAVLIWHGVDRTPITTHDEHNHITVVPDTARHCADIAPDYLPQPTPIESLAREQNIMLQGYYCYDLPLFDDAWRTRGATFIENQAYIRTAQQFDKPSRTYIDGMYAIVYYPDHTELGPEFLYQTVDGWIIDRTAVWDNVRYSYDNTEWFAIAGSYPYLALLQTELDLIRIQLDSGAQAYRLR